MYFLNYLYTLSKNNVHVRGHGSFSILAVKCIIEAQILDAQDFHFLYLWSNYRVRKCTPLRITQCAEGILNKIEKAMNKISAGLKYMA